MLRLHAFFHLNLMFSSIEEEQRPAVIQRCYWPILHLAERLGKPIGIEATGYTLEEIQRLDRDWIVQYRRLIARGLIEPIGSGYAQVIGPLMPALLTEWNLKLGNEVYRRLQSGIPRVALVNEQAYAPGLVPLYSEAEYQALLMDWDMCAYAHPEWDDEWRYHVQLAQGHGAELPVIWTKTVAFQKLQRLAHGDIELGDYLDYILSRMDDGTRTIALYSNDAEVFGFRPGRYKTESGSTGAREWEIVEAAFRAVMEQPGIQWISTAEAISEPASPASYNRLQLESAAFPVPVKKQMKYNVSRWAVTGRADFEINRRCREICSRLARADSKDAALWRRLCWLASSDFRTHITEKRFAGMLAELDRLDADTASLAESSYGVSSPSSSGGSRFHGDATSMDGPDKPGHDKKNSVCAKMPIAIDQTPRRLLIDSAFAELHLNKRKGLAIESLRFKSQPRALIGTIPHGVYDDVVHAFDWFSGTLISEFIGHPKWTDLIAAEPELATDSQTGDMTAKIALPLGDGDYFKTIQIARDQPFITVRYVLPHNSGAIGTLRIANLTLLPDAVDAASLYFETHNGGRAPDRIALAGETIDHGAPVSFLVSASAGVGMTEGSIIVGDKNAAIEISATEDSNAFLGLVTHRMVKGKVFCRIALSAGELDETRKAWNGARGPLHLGYTISPVRLGHASHGSTGSP
jgi:Glycosyl hydrolase family 57